ncbi:MAG: hypothetical protein OK454_11760, partial [Thaumarchaeota archaeon]|nr:hypothetical protein [Nitrososphaerota archaeon]
STLCDRDGVGGSDDGFRGDDSGVCCVFLRFALGSIWGRNDSWSPWSSESGFRGLEGVWHLLSAGAARSRRAFLAALGCGGTRDLGVKKRWNFRGVMDGSRLSFPGMPAADLGGESRLLLSVIVLWYSGLPAAQLSSMAS